MTTGDDAVALGSQRTGLHDRGRALRQWWIAITTSLALAVFAEAAFAGAMLSGVDWARGAHAATAGLLIIATVTASLAAAVTLRRTSQGPRLTLSLLALAVLLFIQAGLGALSAKGANLLWVHVPLGAALLSFATQAAVRAFRLGKIDT